MARIGITYRLETKYGPYRDAVESVGLEPVGIAPPGVDSLDAFDGLVISGGTDLNPGLYSQDAHPENEPPDDERDRMEHRLLLEALEMNLPVLCICRGLQLLNVTFGGDLVQHLDQTTVHRQRGVIDAHVVEVLRETKLSMILGAGRFAVNSRHHQAAGNIGTGLVVSAKSEDGIVEGLEVPGHPFALAVQWHPEDRIPLRGEDTRLFQAFAEAAQIREAARFSGEKPVPRSKSYAYRGDQGLPKVPRF